tara:strand:- start:1607 stop:2503 length:897 start_codon:yes stop_codon:yes gene_type:complete
MAKQKGHRANKPNDSFGAINDENLYRGKYREEVYKDEDEVQESEEATSGSDPSAQEATPDNKTSFAEPMQESESNYKKRYDDLKRHYDSKLDEWKQERDELVANQNSGKNDGISVTELPKTAEELEQFKQKYPDVYGVVETISHMQAENKVNSLKGEIEQLRGREKELEINSAYKELLSVHPDFVTLKTDETFLQWLDEQPQTLQDGIYKNNTDVKWAVRVIDLYKADKGLNKKQRSKRSDPALAITKPTAKDVVNEKDNDKRVWNASEIAKLKPWEFDKLEAEIDSARAEGRINFNS